MASALIGALAPAAISALTSSGGSGGQSNAMSGLMDTAKKAGGGIMSGIGSFVSDLIRGKGFKESLAGGIDTMVGRQPQSTVAGYIPQSSYGVSRGSPGTPALDKYGSVAGIDALKSTLDTTIRSHEGQYIVAVIPMNTFKQMVMMYMAQKNFDKAEIDAVVRQIDAAMSERVVTTGDQNKAISQMQQGAQQYGFPILSQPGFSSRSAQYMYPKYGGQQTPPALQGMPPGGIVASGAVAK